jgi:hypothetical protein
MNNPATESFSRDTKCYSMAKPLIILIYYHPFSAGWVGLVPVNLICGRFMGHKHQEHSSVCHHSEAEGDVFQVTI